MFLDNLQDKIAEIALLSRLNSLTDSSTGKRIAYFSLNELISVNEEIAPSEYEDVELFIRKLLNTTPLLKVGVENKRELESSDFIYY